MLRVMLLSFSRFVVRDSWTVLGPSGREHAMRGLSEIATAFESHRGTLAAYLARGLSDGADLVVAARAPNAEPIEALWESWATRTIGRHFDVSARRLAVGDSSFPAAALVAWLALRGPFDHLELERSLGGPDGPSPPAHSPGDGAAKALWRALAPHPGDYLLALGDIDLDSLVAQLHGLAAHGPLCASPVTVLAVGRALPLPAAIARLSPPID